MRLIFGGGGMVTILLAIFWLWLVVHAPVQPYKATPVANAPLKVAASGTAPLPTPSLAPAPHQTDTPPPPPPTPVHTANYLQITAGCALTLSDSCVTAHSAPHASSSVRARLRRDVLLLINSSTTTADGVIWYEITFDEHLRYPERATMPWYLPATAGTVVSAPVPADRTPATPPSQKRIVVDRSEQTLTTYVGDIAERTYTISTGLASTPTPRGSFAVYRKTPTRYMQGPIPGISTKQYDLPGVPWNLYFTEQGAVIHGAYWHEAFGQPYSNGCVNMRPAEAREVFLWADLGTSVTVVD